MMTNSENSKRRGPHRCRSLAIRDYVEHEGARIWYATYGSGSPVVLLHGGLGHSGNWGIRFRRWSAAAIGPF